MEKLVNEITKIKENKEIYSLIQQRVRDFAFFEKRPSEDWFSELCFCLLTANASAKGGIKVQAEVNPEEFLQLSQEQLVKKLKKVGYRFPNVRSGYIVEARKYSNIKELIGGMDSDKAREFLVKNVKGLGMKEASHFLRNIGRMDLGILDKHILRSLGQEVKGLTPNRYIELEKKLIKLGELTEVNMAELDLMLWYGQTGEILK